jgi:hypothetical protein
MQPMTEQGDNCWNILLVANGITGAGAINKIPRVTAGDNLQ